MNRKYLGMIYRSIILCKQTHPRNISPPATCHYAAYPALHKECPPEAPSQYKRIRRFGRWPRATTGQREAVQTECDSAATRGFVVIHRRHRLLVRFRLLMVHSPSVSPRFAFLSLADHVRIAVILVIPPPSPCLSLFLPTSLSLTFKRLASYRALPVTPNA